MATKKRARRKAPRRRTARTAPLDTLNLQVKVRHSLDTPFYYVNFVEVGHSTMEFALTVGRLPPRLDDASLELVRTTGVIELDPTLQLLVPPTVIPNLIQALGVQWT